MFKQAVLAVSIFAVALALFAGCLLATPSHKKCAAENYHANAQQAESERKSAAAIFLLCQGEALDKNEGVITAIGTLLIAAFTLTLWLVTGKAVALAREEFTATHRPRMHVRFIKGPEAIGDDKWEFCAYLANTGESPATVKQVVFEAFQTVGDDEIEISLAPPVTSTFEIEIGAGLMIRRTARDWGVFDSIWSNPITIRGRVVYEDRNGNSRITSFARVKGSSEGKWAVSEDYAEDEYED